MRDLAEKLDGEYQQYKKMNKAERKEKIYYEPCVVTFNELCQQLKEKNIWAYATDMDGENLYRVNFKGGVALVIGAEGEGVSRLVRETCDVTVSIPMKGHIDSLNASVAAGILMAEVARQRA